MAMAIVRPDFNWVGMSEWWSAHSDGSRSPVSEEGDQENLEHMYDSDDVDLDFYDVGQRVQQIAYFFAKEEDGPVHQIVGPLDVADILVELQELAEYVDIAEELRFGKKLAPLFHYVLCYKYDGCKGKYNKHAAVRTKAAEVITTMVQNNPTNQQLVMEVNGLQPLLDNIISDPDVTAKTKALVAISALIRNNKPGITAFRKENGGYAALRDALSSESVRLQWEVLNLIQYLLHENSSDCNIVTQLGFPRIMMHLTSSDDAQLREAALRGLLVLARDEGGQLVRDDDKLKQVLQERIEGISAMAPEDLGAASEERQLVDSLWNACYNEPSSLGEKGLLVLPGS